MTSSEGPQRLARLARARRVHLGLTQEQLVKRGGPGLGTIRRVEQGIDQPLTDRITSRLEQALSWAPSTIGEVLHGLLDDTVKQQLVTGPEGVGIQRQPDRELLARVSDADLVAELGRRLRAW